MRRFSAALLVLMLIAGCFTAFADYEVSDTMQVVKCEEWVSLREEPDIHAERLAYVQLGEFVTGCVKEDAKFIKCTYRGQTGYILADYLKVADPASWVESISTSNVTLATLGAFGYENLHEQVNGYTVIARTSMQGEGEKMVVACFDANGNSIWAVKTVTSTMTELTLTEAFIGGTADKPYVMVYNSMAGLAALDIETGEVIWANVGTSFGASISYAVDERGTMYIGGYYGPDPICVDVNGNVLWTSDADNGQDDIYWLYEIQIQQDGILCCYEVINDKQDMGQVKYGFDGSVIEIRG